MSTNETEPSARFIPIDRQQMVLRPTDIEQLIGEDHAARNVWAIVGELDLSGFQEETLAVEGHAGRNRWSPQLLISIWIYAYSRGVSSAREISRQCEHEPGLQWLTGLQVVNHHTLSDFRVRHETALRDLFTQVLGILAKNQLITLERVTQDGTKIRANVNKKSFSKAARLRQHLELARKHVEAMEAQSREDEQVTRRQAAARERAKRERVERLDTALSEIEQLQETRKRRRVADPSASSTDNDARFMRTGDGGVAPGYNLQLVTDAAHGLIVDVAVVKEEQDSEQGQAAMERVRVSLNRHPRQLVADAGYTNHTSVLAMAELGIDYYGAWTGRAQPGSSPRNRTHGYSRRHFVLDEAANEYICPAGKRLRYKATQRTGGRERILYAAKKKDCQACPLSSQCCPGIQMAKHGRTVSRELVHPVAAAFDRKMETDAARAIYQQRAGVAEFPNAWIKCKLGMRRFATRGLRKVNAEALWAALTYNLQRFFKLRAVCPA